MSLNFRSDRASLRPMILALAILVLASAFRVFVLYVPILSNFSPVMALAFCAGDVTAKAVVLPVELF